MKKWSTFATLLSVLTIGSIRFSYAGAAMAGFSLPVPAQIRDLASERVHEVPPASGSQALLPEQEYYTLLPLVTTPYRLLYEDDFSNPASGWFTDDSEGFRWSYQQGEFELGLANPENWIGIVDPEDLLVSSYRLEIDLRQATPTDALHGVIFNWQDWDTFSLFLIDPWTARAGLYHLDNGSVIASLPLGSQPAAAVGADWHHIQVDHIGAHMVIWINGTQVADVTHIAPRPFMSVGFYLESNAQAPASLRADNIAVYELPSGYVVSPGASSADARTPAPVAASGRLHSRPAHGD